MASVGRPPLDLELNPNANILPVMLTTESIWFLIIIAWFLASMAALLYGMHSGAFLIPSHRWPRLNRIPILVGLAQCGLELVRLLQDLPLRPDNLPDTIELAASLAFSIGLPAIAGWVAMVTLNYVHRLACQELGEN